MKELIKRFILISLFTLTLGFAPYVKAQKMYHVNEVPNVQLRDYTQFVSDPERVLDVGELASLNQQILEMRDSLTVQVAIVVLPAIDELKYGSARDFAHQLFNEWGIGIKNADNGLLILLLTAEGHREVTFETGYGVEGVLTDGVSKLIQTKVMVPYFKEGAWGKGLIAGLAEIRKVMEGDSEVLRAEEERKAQEDAELAQIFKFITLWNLLGVGVIFLTNRFYLKRMNRKSITYKQYLKRKESPPAMTVVFIFIFFFGYIIYAILKGIFGRTSDDIVLQHAIRCEHCGQRGLVQYRGSKIARKARLGVNGLRAHKFYCSSCGYTSEVMTPFKYVAPVVSAGHSGPWRGGGGGFGGGGGSWGGGMSGGGGASTRF